MNNTSHRPWLSWSTIPMCMHISAITCFKVQRPGSLQHVPCLLSNLTVTGSYSADAAVCDRSWQVLNPATGELVARVPQMKANETKAAIAAASAAWPAWCRKTGKERGAIMRK